MSGIQSLLCQACPLPPSFSAPRQGCRESRVFYAKHAPSRRHSRYPARGVGNPESFMPSMPPPTVIPPALVAAECPYRRRGCPLPPSFSAPRQGCRESRVFYAKHAPSRRHSPRPSRRRMSIPKAGLPPPAVILGTPPGVSGIQSLLCQACPLPPSFSAPRQGCRESRVFYAKHDPSRRHSPRPSRRRMPIPKAGRLGCRESRETKATTLALPLNINRGWPVKKDYGCRPEQSGH